MKTRMLILEVGICALFVAPAFAQKEVKLPPGLPPYGKLQLPPVPNVNVTTLPNGLTVWLVHQPGVPKVAFEFAVRGGMGSDPANLPGLSELFSNTVTQGTKSRSAKQIAQAIQAAGGDLSASADKDDIGLTTSVLSDYASNGLAVLADVAQNATFPEAEVDLAKRNLDDDLTGNEADPSFLARRALARVMYGDYPYGVISPTHQSIGKMTPADLRAEFSSRFRPDQALLVAAGDFDMNRLAAEIQKQFGGWKAPATVPVAELSPAPQNAPHEIRFVARPGSVQTVLSLGTFGPLRGAPDFEAAEIATAIFGGMFSSRLVNNIREDKGYTYSPGAALRSFREAGPLLARAEVRNPVTGASLNEINYELNRVATTSIADEELASAKLFLVGVQAIHLQGRDAAANELANLWVDGLPPTELGSRNQKLQAMTAADVNAAGVKYFPAARMSIVAVGEEKVIRDQLAPFGMELKPAQ